MNSCRCLPSLSRCMSEWDQASSLFDPLSRAGRDERPGMRRCPGFLRARASLRMFETGSAGRNRTCNPPVNSRTLYQIELPRNVSECIYHLRSEPAGVSRNRTERSEPRAPMARPRDLVVNTIIVSLTVLLIFGLVRLLTIITEILLLILIAAILATGINPLIAVLQVFVLIGGIIITPVVGETRAFISQLQQFLQDLQRSAGALQARYPWLPDLSGLIARLPSELAGLSRYFGTAAGVAFRFFGGLVSVITVLFMTFYMLA